MSGRRPWFAIVWFAAWGLFQAYAVSQVISGSWERPAAFPEEAYDALIYPDMVFIPVYLLAAGLLTLRKRAGVILGLAAGGAVCYVMIYLLALADFSGMDNLVADGVFLALNLGAVIQVARMSTRAR